MSTEAPSKENQQQFDDSVDDATHAVIQAFEWCGLPEGDRRSALMVEINDAIAAIMREWQ